MPDFNTAASAPEGYTKTLHLHFLDRILHQRHDAPHPGQEPAQVWVPVGAASSEPAKAPIGQVANTANKSLDPPAQTVLGSAP